MTLSLSASADGFALGEPSSIATPFSFLAEVVPDTVVTLTGPEPAATTDIAEDSIRLVYTYSADDLHGRMLTGSIEVAAAVDGVAVTPTININGARGEITIVLEREAYPVPGSHSLAVTLSLSAAADGFALGEPSSIATPFSFLAEVVPDTVVTLTGPEPAATTDIAEDSIRLGLYLQRRRPAWPHADGQHRGCGGGRWRCGRPDHQYQWSQRRRSL